MKSKTKHFVLFFFLVTLTSWAQNQQRQKFVDSLVRVAETMPDDSTKAAIFGTLYEQLQFSNPALANEYTRKGLELATRIGFKKGIASSNFQLADHNKLTGNIDSARFYYKKAASLFKEIKSLKGELFVNHSRSDFEKNLGNYDKALVYAHRNIDIYNQRDTTDSDLEKTFSLIGSEYELIGSIHQYKGNYKIALSETLKALKFFENKKDTIRQGDAFKQLGAIESLLGNDALAKDYNKRAYTIYEYFNDKQYMALAAIDLGDNHISLGTPLEALPFLEKARQLAKEIKTPSIEANALISLGSAYLALKQFDKSRSFLKQGLAIHEELEYKKSISMDYIELAKLEMGTNRLARAKAYLNNSIKIADEIGAKDNLREAHQLLYKVHKVLNDFPKALAHHELFKINNDSIFNTTKSQQIEELRTIFETEEKEQQIALQENEIVLLEEKQRAATLQNTLLVGGIIALISLFGLLYYGIRQKMKRNKLEKEKVDAELAFKKKELTTHAMHLAKKNEVLEAVKQKAKELKSSESNALGYRQLIKTINFDQQDDKNWESFTQYFEQVHKDFNKTVKNKYPEITKNELRLMALLKMNLSTKEVATILNISVGGVKKARNRLRKKLDITPEDSLEALIISM